MAPPVITTRTATVSELDAVSELCLAAFADEAVVSWVLPAPIRTTDRLRSLFADSLATTVEAEALIVAADPDGSLAGASFWVPSSRESHVGAEATGEPYEGDDLVSRRLRLLDTATAAHQPRFAHHHLSSMAVLPDWRGRGVGSALLRAGLDRAREAGLGVYLEASTAQSCALYRRHGFRDAGEPIHVPDDGPTLRPMWFAPASETGQR